MATPPTHPTNDPNAGPDGSGATTWINGRFVDASDATVSASDAGLLHAIGLFETMLATRGRVFRIDDHLARLARSASDLGLTESLNTRALEEAVAAVVDRSRLAAGDGRARVRLTLTGGDLKMLSPGAGPADPTIVITATPAARYPDEMFERGVGLLIAGAKANHMSPVEGHKTLSYWWRLRALREAAAAHMGEALILQATNHICGGAVSNIFAVKSGSLVTPIARGEERSGAIPSPVLPGVTRQAVIGLAEGESIACERRLMTIDDVLDADELFLTNASWGVLPVSAVERKPIGDGSPGPVTRRLQDLWLEAVSLEP